MTVAATESKVLRSLEIPVDDAPEQHPANEPSQARRRGARIEVRRLGKAYIHNGVPLPVYGNVPRKMLNRDPVPSTENRPNWVPTISRPVRFPSLGASVMSPLGDAAVPMPRPR